MPRLSIFDDNILVGNITITSDGTFFIFAKSSRDWSVLKRLVSRDFTRLKKKKIIKIKPQDIDFLEYVAKLAHSYNYSTELIGD